MSTAYIVQDSRRDLDIPNHDLLLDGSKKTLREVYNDFVHLFERVNAAGYDEGTVSAACRRKLSSFGDENAIVAIGAPFLIGASIAWAAAMNNGRVTVLEWDRHIDAYRSRTLNMFEQKGDLDDPF